jgi:hypothetical protein
VSETRDQVYMELYRKLDTKKRENNVYRMAKVRKRKTRDFNQVKYINDESNRFLIKEEEIKNRWREYFDKLFNEKSEKITIELDDSFDDTNKRFVQKIQESEMKEVLKRMKMDKALGHDDISVELWRWQYCGSLNYLIKKFNPIRCLMSREEYISTNLKE